MRSGDHDDVVFGSCAGRWHGGSIGIRTEEDAVKLQTIVKCVECGRFFDLLDEGDAQEWYYGHDCEEVVE